MISIREFIKRFKQIADTDPRINAFGNGPLYDLQDDIKHYPYLWIINDETHRLVYSEETKHSVIELQFQLRLGDKVNNQEDIYRAYGQNSNNGLDITSDTFTILVDCLNAISFDTLGIFGDIRLASDIDIEPFFNEDNGDVNGHSAIITFRIKNENPCVSPLTEENIL